MKTAIHRYQLQPEVQIPAGAVFLDAQAGQTGLSGWFIVNPDAEPETRRFAIIQTGTELPEAILDCRHLATIKAVLMRDGAPAITALHLFETTDCPVKIPSLDLGPPSGPPSGKPSDPADWWKG